MWLKGHFLSKIKIYLSIYLSIVLMFTRCARPTNALHWCTFDRTVAKVFSCQHLQYLILAGTQPGHMYSCGQVACIQAVCHNS